MQFGAFYMSFSSFDHFWRDVDVTNHCRLETMYFAVAEGMLAELTVPATQLLWFLKLWFGCRLSFFCWTCSSSFLGLMALVLNQRCWHQLALPISFISSIWHAAFALPEHLQMKAEELNLRAPQIFRSKAHGWYSNIFQQRPGDVFDGQASLWKSLLQVACTMSGAEKQLATKWRGDVQVKSDSCVLSDWQLWTD